MFYILEYYYHITTLELTLPYVRNNKQKNSWLLIDINVTIIILFVADEDRLTFGQILVLLCLCKHVF